MMVTLSEVIRIQLQAFEWQCKHASSMETPCKIFAKEMRDILIKFRKPLGFDDEGSWPLLLHAVGKQLGFRIVSNVDGPRKLILDTETGDYEWSEDYQEDVRDAHFLTLASEYQVLFSKYADLLESRAKTSQATHPVADQRYEAATKLAQDVNLSIPDCLEKAGLPRDKTTENKLRKYAGDRLPKRSRGNKPKK